MDFRIFNGGQKDITVRFVCVIKLDQKNVRNNVELKTPLNSFS